MVKKSENHKNLKKLTFFSKKTQNLEKWGFSAKKILFVSQY